MTHTSLTVNQEEETRKLIEYLLNVGGQCRLKTTRDPWLQHQTCKSGKGLQGSSERWKRPYLNGVLDHLSIKISCQHTLKLDLKNGATVG